MRNIFLGLVLANLAYAARQAWLEPQPVPRPSAAAASEITLVSEVHDDLAARAAARAAPTAPDSAEPQRAPPAVADDEQRVADETAGAGVPLELERSLGEGDAGIRCRSVGPFRELAQAATAAATLRAMGHEPTQRVADGEVWIGYWVYIEALATDAEAEAILAKVRAEGIADSYIIPASDRGNLVSLGVFTEIGGMARRREEIRALGYEPAVVDRTRRATVYWVDVMLALNQVLDFDALQPPGRIIRLEQRDCPPPA